jgi:hypothetical protein
MAAQKWRFANYEAVQCATFSALLLQPHLYNMYDKATSDFHLLGPQKETMNGQLLSEDDKVKEAVHY